jgi:hypothetical protein
VPKWSGSHLILHLKGDCNIELLLWHNNKKFILHANRLKPYFVSTKVAQTLPDFFPLQEKSLVTQDTHMSQPNDVQFLLPKDYSDSDTQASTSLICRGHAVQPFPFSHGAHTYTQMHSHLFLPFVFFHSSPLRGRFCTSLEGHLL